MPLRNGTRMTPRLPDRAPADGGLPAGVASLESILAALRRLAITALDGGHPLVAARIAATADQLEASAWPARPPRPSYGSPPDREAPPGDGLSAAPRRG